MSIEGDCKGAKSRRLFFDCRKRRALCKFFRRGFCQNGASCVYSHNAADSRRVPVLCRFYADGFCKSGAECNLLHGEFPCKNFHKGLCKDRYCRYSHEPLNDFTQPIYDEMLEEEALIANISISFEPRKRKVLLPTPQLTVPPKPVEHVANDSSQQSVSEDGGLFSGMLEEMSKTTPDAFPRDENWRIGSTFLQKKIYKLISTEQPPLEFDHEFLKKLTTDKFTSDPRIPLMLRKAEERSETESVSPPSVTKCDSVQDPRLTSSYSSSCDSMTSHLPSVTNPEPLKSPFAVESPFLDQVIKMDVPDIPAVPIKANVPPRFSNSWTDWVEPSISRHQGSYRSRREDYRREERANHGPYHISRGRGRGHAPYSKNSERQSYDRSRGRRSSDRRSLPRDYRNYNM